MSGFWSRMTGRTAPVAEPEAAEPDACDAAMAAADDTIAEIRAARKALQEQRALEDQELRHALRALAGNSG